MTLGWRLNNGKMLLCIYGSAAHYFWGSVYEYAYAMTDVGVSYTTASLNASGHRCHASACPSLQRVLQLAICKILSETYYVLAYPHESCRMHAATKHILVVNK